MDGLTKLEAAVFDLDDTLYDYFECDQHALNALTELDYTKVAYGFAFSLEEFANARNSTKLKEEGLASVSRYRYFEELLKKYPLSDPKNLAEVLEAQYWNFFFEKMRLRRGVEKLIRYLNAQGIPVAVLTDQETWIQEKKLARLGLSEHVNLLLTAEDVGEMKPSPKGLIEIAREFSVSPSSMIMVGDSELLDVEPIQRLGGRGVLVASSWDTAERTKAKRMTFQEVHRFVQQELSK